MSSTTENLGTLIVFTDEKGSTKRDEDDLQSLASGATSNSDIALQEEFVNRRKSLFCAQLNLLNSTDRWTLLKSVGDSLILRADPLCSTELKDFIRNCLCDLMNVWTELNNVQGISVRIAVHYAQPTHLAKGDILNPIITSLSGLKKVGNICSFCESLKFDLFGPGINRAARLSSVPQDALFIVSEHTIAVLEGRTDGFSSKEIAHLYESQKPQYDFADFRGPIPLVSVKGLEGSIGIGKKCRPWWVWELSRKRTTVKSRISISKLGAEQKQFQTLRILQGKFPSSVSLIERKKKEAGADKIDESFEKHLGTIEGSRFFYDLCIYIEDFWRLFNPRDDRYFGDDKPEWCSGACDTLRFLPLYVLLSSAPNEETDVAIRKALQPPIPKEEELGLVPVSYDIHQRLRLASQKSLEDGTNRDSRLYTVLFQIQHASLGLADTPKEAFSGLPASQPIASNFTVERLIWGLLRGDKDGFMILRREDTGSATKDDFETALKEFLLSEAKSGKGGFFSKIAPLKVYVGRSLRQMHRHNIRWLKDAAKL